MPPVCFVFVFATPDDVDDEHDDYGTDSSTDDVIEKADAGEIMMVVLQVFIAYNAAQDADNKRGKHTKAPARQYHLSHEAGDSAYDHGYDQVLIREYETVNVIPKSF